MDKDKNLPWAILVVKLDVNHMKQVLDFLTRKTVLGSEKNVSPSEGVGLPVMAGLVEEKFYMRQRA